MSPGSKQSYYKIVLVGRDYFGSDAGEGCSNVR